MIRSMTGFARRERHGAWGGLTLELRSVNHRYLESVVRLPEALRAVEPLVRERIGGRLGRGKVECNVRFQEPAEGGGLEVNRELAERLAHLSREVDALLYNPAPISSLAVLQWPGVLVSSGPDPEQLQQELLALLDEALEALVEMREREGEKLAALIRQRSTAMAEAVVAVRARLPEVKARYRERLQERLTALRGEVDESRLEQELVLFAQKMDVEEELDRLEAHLGEITHTLGQREPVGRRLDFLMQELNREANTLASKAADSETSRMAVELKVLIEQMREQIQNIE